MVIPQSYIRELQNLRDDLLYPIQAVSQVSYLSMWWENILTIAKDVMGEYTGLSILASSYLNYNVIRKKLTPKLGKMKTKMEDEMRYAIAREMPPCRVCVINIS